MAAVSDYLAYKHYFFFRINNIGIYDPTKKVRRAMPKHSKKGVADMLVIRHGAPIFLEFKSAKGKQSEDQKEFEKECKEAGAEYHVIRSVDEVIHIGL